MGETCDLCQSSNLELAYGPDGTQRGLSIHKARFRTNIAIEIRFVDQVPQRLDIRIAALPESGGAA